MQGAADPPRGKRARGEREAQMKDKKNKGTQELKKSNEPKSGLPTTKPKENVDSTTQAHQVQKMKGLQTECPAVRQMDMGTLRAKRGFICDMDGVIYHGNKLLPGVKKFLNWLIDNEKHYLFLTNSSEHTPLELHEKLRRMGLDVPQDRFYTSALATACFLASQNPGCSAYVIGDHGLFNALYDEGIAYNDVNPDYVVVGESSAYNMEQVTKAVRLVNAGAKLIGTNYDLTGPTEFGIKPACRALVAPIELATGKKAYFVGKPNPLMMRTGLRMLDVHSQDAVMIGDRMDTDVIAGIETGLTAVLALSGVTSAEDCEKYPYRPNFVLNGVGDIAE